MGKSSRDIWKGTEPWEGEGTQSPGKGRWETLGIWVTSERCRDPSPFRATAYCVYPNRLPTGHSGPLFLPFLYSRKAALRRASNSCTFLLTPIGSLVTKSSLSQHRVTFSVLKMEVNFPSETSVNITDFRLSRCFFVCVRLALGSLYMWMWAVLTLRGIYCLCLQGRSEWSGCVRVYTGFVPVHPWEGLHITKWQAACWPCASSWTSLVHDDAVLFHTAATWPL